jgi:hypothetical protein
MDMNRITHYPTALHDKEPDVGKVVRPLAMFWTRSVGNGEETSLNQVRRSAVR